MTVTTEQPTVTVVICVYTERRWSDLVAAVLSVLAQTRPAVETVVVVDHNPALLARARECLEPAVRVLENQRTRGLSGARNTALRAVGGDVVAFLDDDAAARPDWLARLIAPYADPRVAAVGGVARPVWPHGLAPALLPAELHWVVGCSYTGQHPGSGRVEVRNLMGCNMSFRQSVLRGLGGFAEDIGRVGDVPLGCEETELCIRLRQRIPAAMVVFEPAAVVDHHVSRDRITWAYLRRRCRAEGVSKAVVGRRVGFGAGLAAERAYTRRVLPVALARELRSALRGLFAADRTRLRRGATAALAIPLALLVAAGGYLSGRWSGDAEPRPTSASATSRRVVAEALLALGALSCALAMADARGGPVGGLRLSVTAAFLLLGPGWSVAGFLRRAPASLVWTLAFGAGAAVSILGGQAMAQLEFWHPVGALYLLAGLCAPLLFRHAVAAR